MAFLVGQKVFHYQILDMLGEGGMSVVCEAKDSRFKRTVALKFLPCALKAHERERARLMQEDQAAAGIRT